MSAELAAGIAADIDFTCPRCQTAVTERFYGPCCVCRATLRLERGRDARDVTVEAYEPKMNVTPNAVALKD